MPYTAILVDDEPWSIIDITHSIDWDETDFRVVGTYDKAREALDAIVEKQPNVVFTDIRMPGLDGFELIEQCRQQNVQAEFVILSSYSDFSYAQQAIKAAVTDYCLKPINPDALKELLASLSVRFAQKDIPTKEDPANGFDKIVAYTRKHFTKKLLLSDISEKFSFHRNYVCHLFKKNLNTSFSSYINALRIEEAEKLLAHSALSAEEIADRLGIDYYYFCKLFKKETGQTPMGYRKNHARKGEWPC